MQRVAYAPGMPPPPGFRPPPGFAPYAGAMAWADGVLVTADSCSMLSEAVSLGVPVFVSRFKNARGKTARFLAACATRGECVDAATPSPPRAAEGVSGWRS